jgi:phage tail sheath gpL-like
MTSISIVGFTSDDKVPGVYGQTSYGAGRVSVGAFPVKCLVTGNKTSTGSMTADADISQIISADDADAKLGAGSECAIQCYGALAVDGVTLYAAPVLEAAGGVAAVITIQISGTWTATGQLDFSLHGRQYSIGIAAQDVILDVATKTRDIFNSNARSPVVATMGAGATYIVTLTVRSAGERGKDYLLFCDKSRVPAGMTVSITGGTAIHSGARSLTPFGTGAGTDSIAPVVALLAADVYDFVAPAQNGSVAAAAWKSHVESECSATIGHLEHFLVATSGTSAAAASLAGTTMNSQRGSVVWLQYSETHPAAVAATCMALISTLSPQNPNTNYDEMKLPGVAPQSFPSDVPSHSTKKTMLNSGVTPLKTDGSDVRIVGGIQSHCLNGTSPDYRTFTWGDAHTPDRTRKEIAACWQSVKQDNPWNDETPPAGTLANEGKITPDQWNPIVIEELKREEKLNWITRVDANLPYSLYDGTRKCIMTACPVIVTPQTWQLGVLVMQTAA